MSCKVTKKDLIANFRKLSIDNLINLTVLTDYCINKSQTDSYYRSVMFSSDDEFHEFCKFNLYLKYYEFGHNPIAELAGVFDDE